MFENAFQQNAGHCDGNRQISRSTKKELDSIKEDCSDLGISLYDATQLAGNR